MKLQIYVHRIDDNGSGRQVSVVRPNGVHTIKFSPEESKDVPGMCTYLKGALEGDHAGDEATVTNGALSEAGHELLAGEFGQILSALRSAGINVS